MKKLNKKELKELKGGEVNEIPSLPKRNVNRTAFCTCSYNDLNAIENINKVSGCVCDCIGKSQIPD